MAAAGSGKSGETGGDGPPDQDNPFSFTKFIKKRGTDKSGSDSDWDEGDSETLSEEESTIVEEKKKKTDENPFSFKKFLQASNNSSAGRVSSNNSPGRINTLDLASDLPDFVQDYYHNDRDHSRTRPRNSSTESNLPDFALDLDTTSAAAAAGATPGRSDDHRIGAFDASSASGSSKNANCFGARPKIKSNENVHHYSDLASDYDLNNVRNSDCQTQSFNMTSDTADRRPAPQNSSNSLPDFLSDSAIGVVNHGTSRGLGSDNVCIPIVGLESCLRPCENFSESKSLVEFQEENRELRKQLNDAVIIAQKESARAVALEKEVETIRSHETDEMTALEKMVQKVEANLLSTTERALTAENFVVKLKQEIKSLQAQVQSLQLENNILRNSNFNPVKERALSASQQISAAATEAEKLLRQLLSGVDTLKTVSEILASADKFTDLPPDEGNDNSECHPK